MVVPFVCLFDSAVCLLKATITKAENRSDRNIFAKRTKKKNLSSIQCVNMLKLYVNNDRIVMYVRQQLSVHYFFFENFVNGHTS